MFASGNNFFGLSTDTKPVSPASGYTFIEVDTGKTWVVVGGVWSNAYLAKKLNNFSSANQVISAASRTYLAGSSLSVPVSNLQIGTVLRWKFNMTKTAAGLAASTFDIAFGTNGSVSDVARVSFTKPAGTAVADQAWVDIIATVRGPLSASGVVVGQFIMGHNLQITGHAIIPCICVNTISSAFDLTVANLIVGICLTSGSADAITVNMVQSEAINL